MICACSTLLGSLQYTHAHSAYEWRSVKRKTSIDCMQGAVYDLVEEHGRPLNLVLKAVGSSATAWLSSILPSMEREWAIGQRLAMHCTTPAGKPSCLRLKAELDTIVLQAVILWHFCMCMQYRCRPRLTEQDDVPTGLHPGFMRVGAALIVEQPVRERSKSTPGCVRVLCCSGSQMPAVQTAREVTHTHACKAESASPDLPPVLRKSV